MARVTLYGWKEGFQKVQTNKLLREKAGLSLSQAKHTVDMLLDGKSVSLEIPDRACATALIEEASMLGVECKLDD